jgi:hypothetical protein
MIPKITLDSAEVAEFFEPSVQAAITSIKAQVDASQGMIKVRYSSPTTMRS